MALAGIVLIVQAMLFSISVCNVRAEVWTTSADLSQGRFAMGVGADSISAVFAAGSTQNQDNANFPAKMWPAVGSGTQTIDVFRASSRQFTTLFMPLSARFGMACAGASFRLHDAVFCGGGGNGTNDFSDGIFINSTLAEEHQGNYLVTGVMRIVAEAFSVGRSYAAATTNGRFVVFAGGMLSSTPFNAASVTDAVEIHMLDSIASGRMDATLSVARTAVSAASAGQLSFFAGGFIGDGSPVNTVDIWQSTTNSWRTETLAVARGGAHGAVSAGIVNPPIIVFAAGGGDASNNAALRTTDLFAINALGTDYVKSQGPDCSSPVERSCMLGGFDDGRVVMWGGMHNTDTALNDAWIFLGKENQWFRNFTALSQSRRDVACIRTGFSVLVGAGQADAGPSARVDITDYTPQGTTGAPAVYTTESVTTFEISTTGERTTSLFTTGTRASSIASTSTSSTSTSSTSTSSSSAGLASTTADSTNLQSTIASASGSTSSSPPDDAVATVSGSSDAFPVWIIAIAAGGCLCSFLVVVLVVLRRRRLHTGDDDDFEMIDDAPAAFDDNEESNYDRITNYVRGNPQYQSAVAIVAAAKGAYARIPSVFKVVEGNYARIPVLQQNSAFSDAVAVLSADEVMLDVSNRVGKGSFGDVFRGNYRGVDVAVKMLKNEFSTEQLQSFYVEAEVIAAVPPHEFLVGFLGVTPSPFMILTEFCGQGSLLRFLRSSSSIQMSTAQSLKLVADVAEGMRHLSSHGIVHRDLAARNVLLTNNRTPKIADFGLSRTVDQVSQQHHSKSVSGPVRWMSVECIRKGIFSEASDVWSFAVFVYEAFSRGSTPYGNKVATMEVARMVLAGHRLEFPDAIPPSLVNLFELCMDADPAKRPTFAAIVEKLDEEADAGEIIYADLGTLGTLQGQTATDANFDLSSLRQ